MQRYLLPRLGDFIFIVIFGGALLSGARMLNTDGDLGRHLTLGGYILQSARIPTRDILSFTRPAVPRPPYEWLAQVLFAEAFRLLALDGVVLLTALIIATAFTTVYLDALHRGHMPLLALIAVVLAAAASSLHWLSRPHVISFLFFALWLAMLERIRKREPLAWWLPPLLMLLWANTHGGFIFGFLAFAAYLAGWLLDHLRHGADLIVGRRLLVTGAASLATSIVTPDLWGNWTATLNNRSPYVLSRTAETMPLNPSSPNIWPFLLFVALVVVLIWLCRHRLPAAHWILMAGLALAAFVMTRNIPFFVIAAAPLSAEWLSGLLNSASRWSKWEAALMRIDSALQGFVWPALAVVLGLILFLSFHSASRGRAFFQFDPDRFPVRAVDWIQQEQPHARLFNDVDWGGYLLFRLWPQQRVFIDSQSDFYGEAFIRRYVGIVEGGPDWARQLQDFGITAILVRPGAPLAALLRSDPGWQTGYQDMTAVVFVRK